MQHYTTYFDKNYLTRGLVLIESLQKQSAKFELYVLCLDEVVLNYFEENKSLYTQVKTIALDEFEKEDEELLACKTNRSIIEYYFTLSPCLPLYVLKKYNLPHICSLDADIKFYASPQSLFDYLLNHSIIITPHKFSKEVEYLEKYGKNNVSFQIFKNDQYGLECLELWRKQCVEWCKDEFDEINNRFADQKYLDDWEEVYTNKVKVLNDMVSGLAPWNLNNFKITINNKVFYSNNKKIIFFHFHHNKFFNNRWVTNGFKDYKVSYQKNHLKIYKDYWESIEQKAKKLNATNENFIRTGNIGNLKNYLFKEQTVFLIINKFCFLYLDFRTLNRFKRKIILKIYA
jgi:hypothetical protein